MFFSFPYLSRSENKSLKLLLNNSRERPYNKAVLNCLLFPFISATFSRWNPMRPSPSHPSSSSTSTVSEVWTAISLPVCHLAYHVPNRHLLMVLSLFLEIMLTVLQPRIVPHHIFCKYLLLPCLKYSYPSQCKSITYIHFMCKKSILSLSTMARAVIK